MKKSVTLHEGMGEAVLKRLREFSDLPAAGYVAGQAVSSAVSELFGDGRAVIYNDVDVFRPVTAAEEAQYRERERAREEQRQQAQGEARLQSGQPSTPGRFTPLADSHPRSGPLTNLCTFTSLEVYEDQYRQLVYSTQHRYEVRSTSREGMLNQVACAHLTDKPQRFLETFDLNAVQVGVDLASQQLVWTPEFAQFRATRQLEIVTLHTPFHSLVRYFKKRQELEGIYGNDERAIELIGAAYYRADEARKLSNKASMESLCMRWRFGQMYKEKLDAVADKILPHFEVIAPASTNVPVYRLKPRFDVAPDLLAKNGDIVHVLPRASRALREKHRKGLQERLAYAATAESPSVVRTAWLHKGDSYFAANVTAAELKRMDKTLRSHYALSGPVTALPTLEAQWAAVKLLQTEAARRGGWVYGAIETANDVDLSPEGVTKRLDEQAAYLSQTLRKSQLPDMSIQDYTFTDLVTGMALHNEGEALHHCVGGYAGAVKAGVCHIVSVRKGELPDAWLTLEMHREQHGRWARRQLRGLQNRDATPEERAIVAEYEKRFYLAKAFGVRLGGWLARWPKAQSAALKVSKTPTSVLFYASLPWPELKGYLLRATIIKLARKVHGTDYIQDSRQGGHHYLYPKQARFWVEVFKQKLKVFSGDAKTTPAFAAQKVTTFTALGAAAQAVRVDDDDMEIPF